MGKAGRQYLLVEPVAKTPYPPLGLMKIGSMLRRRNGHVQVFDVVGMKVPANVRRPHEIFISSLFTWDMDRLVQTIHYYADHYPRSRIHLGGIAASLLPDHIRAATGVVPHVGLYGPAERCNPDYTLTFGRTLDSSITFTTRGCPRSCRFCSVSVHEPHFRVRKGWEKDISPELPRIQVWDNNFLASPSWAATCEKLEALGKWVDFNQGLDARLFGPAVAHRFARLKLEAVRFAFDSVRYEKSVLRAVELAKRDIKAEVRVYVLYNYNDTPEDFYYRIDLMNRCGALAFPMEYRPPTASTTRFPGKHWDKALLRALKLSLLYYYRRGMITESRESFLSIYGRTPAEFTSRLYEIFEYDKRRKPNRRTGT